MSLIQCGHRYYAGSFFRDLQNVFHDIISGDLWEVSSVICSNCTKGIEFLIKIESLRRKKRKSGWPRLLGNWHILSLASFGRKSMRVRRSRMVVFGPHNITKYIKTYLHV